MSIRKADLHFTKASKSIIIFNKARGNKLKVSRIVLHTAFTLSDTPALLENVTIEQDDKLICICGHGNAKKGTIGGRKIEEIAEYLLNAGYNGQQIYITSCGSNKSINGTKSIAEELNAMLSFGIFRKQNKDIQENSESVKLVYSDADGNTITIKNNSDEPEIYIVKDLKPLKELSITLATGKDIIEIISAQSDLQKLKEINDKHYKQMQETKKYVLQKIGKQPKTPKYFIKRIKSKIDDLIARIHSIG